MNWSEIIIYNLIFWTTYYWVCSIPGKLMARAIEEGSRNVGNDRKNGN